VRVLHLVLPLSDAPLVANVALIVVFPLLGLAVQVLVTPVLTPGLCTGVLMLIMLLLIIFHQVQLVVRAANASRMSRSLLSMILPLS
jgi:hypothetical protein